MKSCLYSGHAAVLVTLFCASLAGCASKPPPVVAAAATPAKAAPVGARARPRAECRVVRALAPQRKQALFEQFASEVAAPVAVPAPARVSPPGCRLAAK